eukprot:GFUD01040218.1.p1 GENE.GFUD01040218.1~~GFUD01040218.1.p1  ORF type:complete len:191 (-),score=34.31 GFUD01040218.1:91-615(-)
MLLLSLVLLLSTSTFVRAACPPELENMPNAVFSQSMGCVYADADMEDRYDTYERALFRCKEIMGGRAILAEIGSASDQKTVLEAMLAAEATFDPENLNFSYWWSGLRDDDDDGEWIWVENGPAIYTNWNARAVPNHSSFNCMQLLSATNHGGEWMTFLCGDNYINTHPLCQLPI